MSIPDNGDTINVSPARLKDTASAFLQASGHTIDLRDSLQNAARQLINDMYAELHHSPNALEQLCNRWYNSTTNLGQALSKVAYNLNTAAENYQDADQKGMPNR